jgi:hypothetical protein
MTNTYRPQEEANDSRWDEDEYGETLSDEEREDRYQAYIAANEPNDIPEQDEAIYLPAIVRNDLKRSLTKIRNSSHKHQENIPIDADKIEAITLAVCQQLSVYGSKF